MANSMALTHRRQCPACEHSSEHSLWLIVDTSERPDLEQLVREDRLREGACPVCGAPVDLTPAILLLYRPERDPLLLLAFPEEDESQVQEIGGSLLSELRDSLGPAWHDAWLDEVITVRWEALIRGYREAEVDVVARLEAMAAELPEDACAGTRTAVHLRLARLGAEGARASLPGARAFAIDQYTAALAHATRPWDARMLHNSLAQIHLEVPSDDRAADAEAAIGHARAAIAGGEPGDDAHALALGNLGAALVARVHGDRAVDLDEAVEALTTASRLLAGHVELQARVHIVLATALVDRVNGGRSANVDRALRVLGSTAETLADLRSPLAGSAFMALGNTLASRLDGDRDEDLRSAIAAYERGIALPGVPAQDQAMLHLNAGNAHRELARRHHGPADRAIEQYHRALRLSGVGLPTTRAEAQENLALALEPRDGPDDFARAATMLHSAAREYRRTGAARNERRALRTLGDFHFTRSRWAEADRAYAEAAETDEPLFTGAESVAGRRAEVAVTGRMHGRWAYALARLGAPDRALTTFENGRTRTMRLALSAGAGPGARAAGPAGIDEILSIVPAAGALVAVLGTVHGGLALVVPDGSAAVDLVWLDEVDDELVQTMLVSRAMIVAAEDDEFASTAGAVSTSIVVAKLDDDMTKLCGRLWETVWRPVTERLRQRGLADDCPLTLMAAGGLGLLPLHVGVTERPRHPVTVAPSAFAVRRAFAAEPHDGRRTVVLGDPTGDLPFAAIEAGLVAARAGAELLTGAAATSVAFLDLVRATRPSHLHLACHGEYGWGDPARSRLYLADGGMTLADVEAALADGGPTSVMLSACESGVTQLGATAEEYLGWPVALLQAGVSTIISTLWPVADVSTALLVDRFYRDYFGGWPASVALLRAQTWLRELTAAALLDWVDESAPNFADRTIAEDLREELTQDFQPDDRPFEDPLHWASFFVTGRQPGRIAA